MNYHTMDETVVLSRLGAMREWFKNNIGHPQWPKVDFAFVVATNALEIRKELVEEGRREYQRVIDFLC